MEVAVLQRAGVETLEFCEGGQGHAYREPTVRFHGKRNKGFRAPPSRTSCEATSSLHSQNLVH